MWLLFHATRTGIEQHGPAQHRNQSPSGALVSPRVPTARNVYRGCCRFDPYEESKEHGRPQAAKKSPVGSFLVPRVAAPSIRACLGRHVRLAGRCPNNSSLHRPLAAVVVVASPND